MSLDLQTLGFTQEELQNRVVDQMCDRLMSGKIADDDGEPVSRIRAKMQEKITAQIDSTLAALIDKTIGPNIDKFIHGIIIQPTNAYGEKKGEGKTLIEYLTDQAKEYLNEKVDSEGNGQGQKSYGWTAESTRAYWMANRELRKSIVASLNEVLAGTNASLADAIATAVKQTVENLKTTFQVSVPPLKR